MSQIEVSVYDQTAYFNHTPDIFSGDVGIDTVKFVFDNTWGNFDDKTAVFYNEPKKSYPVILDDDNTATIPKTVINSECTLYFGVMGTNESGDVKTSSILSYRISRGAISADTEVLSTSTDVWLQILVNYEIALNQVADMKVTLADMDNRLAVMDKRIIDSAQENKANKDLSNVTVETLRNKLNLSIAVSKTTLYDGAGVRNETVSFADSIYNYDFIQTIISVTVESNPIKRELVPTSFMSVDTLKEIIDSNGYAYIPTWVGTDLSAYKTVSVKITNTEMTMPNANDFAINRIIVTGFKFSV